LISPRPIVLLTLLVTLAVCTVGAPREVRAQDAATVEISTHASDGSMRLILSHSRSAVYAIRASRGRLELLYSEPIAIDPPRARINDPLLDRYELKDKRTLILFTGPAYERYESFELRNPFRLVLDLQGTRPGKDDPPNRKPKAGTGGTIIVIDPGHGGIELGAVGPGGLREKEVTLDLARRLRRLLQKDRGVSVVLTRDEDRVVGLDERTAIANYNRATLFLSIHLNASRRASARGAETYFLSSDATDDEARTLAALENEASGVEGDKLPAAGEGLEMVLWDLAQNQYMAESSALAERVQRHLNELTGIRDRGIRQAPFRVLMGATMPAILVEVGFISNPEEEEVFKDAEYRDRNAQAIAAAVREFLGDLERLSGPRGSRRDTGRSGQQ